MRGPAEGISGEEKATASLGHDPMHQASGKMYCIVLHSILNELLGKFGAPVRSPLHSS